MSKDDGQGAALKAPKGNERRIQCINPGAPSVANGVRFAPVEIPVAGSDEGKIIMVSESLTTPAMQEHRARFLSVPGYAEAEFSAEVCAAIDERIDYDNDVATAAAGGARGALTSPELENLRAANQAQTQELYDLRDEVETLRREKAASPVPTLEAEVRELRQQLAEASIAAGEKDAAIKELRDTNERLGRAGSVPTEPAARVAKPAATGPKKARKAKAGGKKQAA